MLSCWVTKSHPHRPPRPPNRSQPSNGPASYQSLPSNQARRASAQRNGHHDPRLAQSFTGNVDGSRRARDRLRNRGHALTARDRYRPCHRLRLLGLVDGVQVVRAGLREGHPTSARILLIVMGVAALIAAFFAIFSPAVAAVTLTWILGIWLIVAVASRCTPPSVPPLGMTLESGCCW